MLVSGPDETLIVSSPCSTKQIRNTLFRHGFFDRIYTIDRMKDQDSQLSYANPVNLVYSVKKYPHKTTRSLFVLHHLRT